MIVIRKCILPVTNKQNSFELLKHKKTAKKPGNLRIISFQGDESHTEKDSFEYRQKRFYQSESTNKRCCKANQY